MAYTPFAAMAALLLLTVSVQTQQDQGNPINHVEVDTNRIKGTQSMIESSLGTYANKSISNLANLTKSTEISNFNFAAYNLTQNGRYKNGEQNATVDKFDNRFEKISGDVGNIDTEIESIEASNFTLEIDYKSNVTIGSLDRNYDAVAKYKISDIDDPLLYRISYDSSITQCKYQDLATKIGTGTSVNGTARGFPDVNPSTVNPASDKILVADDITTFNSADTNSYAGYITQSNPSNPENYNSNYVIGAATLPDFEESQLALIHDGSNPGYWKTNLHRTAQNNCYLSSTSNLVPSIKDRFENRTRGSTPQGVFTLLDEGVVGQNPSESNIGFERVDKPGDLVEIHGVTSGNGVTNSSFRINRSRALETGLETLIK